MICRDCRTPIKRGEARASCDVCTRSWCDVCKQDAELLWCEHCEILACSHCFIENIDKEEKVLERYCPECNEKL